MQIKTPIGFLLSHVRLSQYLYLPHFEMLASAVMVSDSVGFMFLKYNALIQWRHDINKQGEDSEPSTAMPCYITTYNGD